MECGPQLSRRERLEEISSVCQNTSSECRAAGGRSVVLATGMDALCGESNPSADDQHVEAWPSGNHCSMATREDGRDQAIMLLASSVPRISLHLKTVILF